MKPTRFSGNARQRRRLRRAWARFSCHIPVSLCDYAVPYKPEGDWSRLWSDGAAPVKS